MKSVKLFKVGLFALLYFATFHSHGQGTPIHYMDTVDMNGNYWGMAGGHFSIQSDSLLFFLYPRYENDSGRFIATLDVLRKKNLSIKDRIMVDTSEANTRQFTLSNPQDGKKFILVREDNGISTWTRVQYEPLTGNLQKNKKSHVFSLPKQLNHLGSEIIGYEYIEGSSTIFDDTVNLFAYDKSGNLKRSNTIILDTTFRRQSKFWRYNSTMNFGPLISPLTSKELIIGSTFRPLIATFSRDSLSIKSLMSLIPINLPISPGFIREYQFTKNKIMAFGEGSYCNNCNSNPMGVRQSYYVERAWDGTLLKEITLGDTTVPEIGLPMAYDNANNTSYLASGAPYRVLPVDGQEFREVVIYRLNPFGRDSIRLFGQKNHLPRRLRYDSQNGDLFLVSAHTNAWSDRASFITLTKIPNFVLSLIEDNKIEADIHIYPNPAQDFITVDAFHQKVQKVEVYNQSGKKLKTVTKPGKKVDVSFLKTGLYVIVVTDSEEKQFSSLLKKK